MEFKVNAKVSEIREVELSEAQAYDFAVRFLRQTFDLPEDCYIDNVTAHIKINSRSRHIEDTVHRKEGSYDRSVLYTLRAMYEKRYGNRNSSSKQNT